ncbi:hypothetical protein FQR65_LT13211 [Abscondita terminalis]|nr:hypothetical protein FQR65_LT13211 [Abscondita terminalis]
MSYVKTLNRCVYLLVPIVLLIMWFEINNNYLMIMEKLMPDYSRLINLDSFKFIILHQCDSAPFLETWGVERAGVRILFMLGNVRTQEEQLQIEEENEIHKDIIQGSFLDTYRNLSYKHAMTLKYVTYHCSHTQYVLKVDDDIFVNMPTLLDFLKNDSSTYGAKGRMLCYPSYNLVVPRSNSKWETSFEEYNGTHFPLYCLGFSTIYSPDVVNELYRVVQKTKYFWIEDVFVTGIVRSKTDINISGIKSMYLERDGMNKIMSQRINIPFIFSPIELSVKEMYAFNEVVNNITVQNVTG